ncbi:MAG TPA: hypothetical protein VGC01_02910 [Mucilaginibacter sp.]
MIKAFLIFIALPFLVKAQSDTGKHSPVRTLTYQQYQDYLKGEGVDDMGMVAVINHYPMPDKVLKLKKELDLSPIQIKKINDINAYMHKRRLQTGGSIIQNERTLDSLFRYHKIDDGTLIFYANRHGLYQGELKNAILQACVATEKELTPAQIKLFETLQKSN